MDSFDNHLSLFGYRQVGSVPHVPSVAIGRSKVGLGFEKLDRGVFDPEKAYDYVAALGVKWARLQSGWERTEKERGVYDFGWLDAIVDRFLADGIQPWICLCYGHGLYDEAAAKVFGAVGCPPIHSPEAKAAWARYVTALVARYKGRVEHFEVWNEPDGQWCWKHGVNGREYGQFVLDTVAAIHAGNPGAKVLGGVMCGTSYAWLSDVASTGAIGAMWGFTYHEYTTDETHNPEKVRFLRAFLTRYNPDIRIIQGESGSQSRHDGAGALRGLAWTQEKQARQLLRHTVSDLLCDVEFLSFFTCVDMIEALNGTVGDKASYLDYGYFGVLSAEFDEDGHSTGTYTPKLAYRALQNLAALFREEPAVAELPVEVAPAEHPPLIGWFAREPSFRELTTGGFRRPDGSAAYAYWKPADLITETYFGSASFRVAGEARLPRLCDPMTGAIYEIPEKCVVREADLCYALQHLPCLDYPLLLLWGDFEAPGRSPAPTRKGKP